MSNTMSLFRQLSLKFFLLERRVPEILTPHELCRYTISHSSALQSLSEPNWGPGRGLFRLLRSQWNSLADRSFVQYQPRIAGGCWTPPIRCDALLGAGWYQQDTGGRYGSVCCTISISGFCLGGDQAEIWCLGSTSATVCMTWHMDKT